MQAEARGGTNLPHRLLTAAGSPERWQQRYSQGEEQVEGWAEKSFGLRHGGCGRGRGRISGFVGTWAERAGP